MTSNKGFLSAVMQKIQSYYWVSTEERNSSCCPKMGAAPFCFRTMPSRNSPLPLWSTTKAPSGSNRVWCVSLYTKKPSWKKVFPHDERCRWRMKHFPLGEQTCGRWCRQLFMGRNWTVGPALEGRSEDRRGLRIKGKIGARWALGKTNKWYPVCWHKGYAQNTW